MQLTPSETVYFHPAAFARPKSLVDAVALAHTDQKYDASELGTAALAAALLGAEGPGAVKLEPGKSGRLFGLRKVDAAIVRAGAARPAFPAGTLEHAMVAAVQERERDVEDVVKAVLRTDSPDPYVSALALVEEGLASRGLLEARESRRLKVFRARTYVVPPATAELAKSTTASAAKDAADAAAATRPDLWRLVLDGIHRAAKARTETSGPDGPD